MALLPGRVLLHVAIAATLLTAVVVPARAGEVIGETGIKGAGSTFAYPLISRWSLEYRRWLASGGEFPAANSGLEDPPASSALEYESVGSLAGTLRVKDGAVDFGASDMPLGSAELAGLGLIQFPIVMGGVVVAVNVAGLGPADLKLTGPVLADIFLGNITRWSDERIKAHNPSLNLPDAHITVVRRSDGSGTTFNFTDFLAQVSPVWKLKVGSGLLVPWPVGVSAKGNEGVGRAVRDTPNSIGYIDQAQAQTLKLRQALLQNRAGNFVKAEAATFQAAAASVDWSRVADFRVLLTNTAGKDAYPITATVFALMRKAGPPARVGSALEFFRWSLERGGSAASRLGYVPLPTALVEQVVRSWASAFPRS